MATIYTTKIVTPALCAFHDIEGIESIQHWVDSNTPLKYPQGVEYPFYNKPPTWPTSLKTHYGFAPYCNVNFFAYGSQFLNTTAHYLIYDEYQTDPGSGGVVSDEIDKYIPPYINYPTPSANVPLSEDDEHQCSRLVYYTVYPPSPSDDNILTSSYMMYGMAINGQSYDTLINLQNEIPEVIFSTTNTGTSLQLQYTVDSTYARTNLVYNIAVNSIKIPIFLDQLTTSKYICSISSSSLIYPTTPQSPLYGGKATYMHN